MSTITETINVCDRCGSRHKASEYMAGNHWGNLNVVWNGDKGGRSYAGDAGGITIKGKAWLCETCTEAFEEFMKPITKEQP